MCDVRSQMAALRQQELQEAHGALRCELGVDR
jgi:hypothetical protein